MNITEYLTTDMEIRALAEADNLVGGKSILEAVAKYRDKRRIIVEGDGLRLPDSRLNPECVSDHVAFDLGVLHALNWVLRLPEVARKFIEKIAVQ